MTWLSSQVSLLRQRQESGAKLSNVGPFAAWLANCHLPEAVFNLIRTHGRSTFGAFYDGDAKLMTCVDQTLHNPFTLLTMFWEGIGTVLAW